MRKCFIWAVPLIVADQIAKFAVRRFVPGEGVPLVGGFFDLVYVQNRGAAWGMLAGWRYVFVAIAVLMLVLFWRNGASLFGGSRFGAAAMVLLTAGIAGNTIDRLFLGYVVDFLDFHVGASHFPAFNVADACICVGAALYCIASLAPKAQGDSGDCGVGGTAAGNG